jgi:hypothetical protein
LWDEVAIQGVPGQRSVDGRRFAADAQSLHIAIMAGTTLAGDLRRPKKVRREFGAGAAGTHRHAAGRFGPASCGEGAVAEAEGG